LANLGITFIAAGKLEEAITWFRRAVDVEPRNANARRVLATALLDRGDLPGAAAQAREGIALSPNDPALRDRLVTEGRARAEEFSQDLRDQTVEDLIRMASDFTRKQPALVFGLASLAGFLAFRVLKSSPPKSAMEHDPMNNRFDPMNNRFEGRTGQFHGT